MTNQEFIIQYLNDLNQANSEGARKERFQQLLLRLFGKEEETSQVIREMSLGSEKVILNIAVTHRSERGRADTQYRNVIIEYERDLQKTGNHAKEQLAEYLSGNWKLGGQYNFTLIATDGKLWHIYSPRYEDFLQKDNVLAKDYVLYKTDTFDLTKENADDFYFFLDCYLFRNEKIIATLERIKNDFGETSDTFLTAIGIFKQHFESVHEDPHLQSAYKTWFSFLSIAYGKFQSDVNVFLVHSYLSVLTKLLAYMVITKDEYIPEENLKKTLDGQAFRTFNIENFVEDDFYGWVSDEPHFSALKKAFQVVALKLSDFSFDEVKEDILKGVYQELIDLETRHALGEYYTPDWLCTRLTKHLNPQTGERWMDPSCGSGSFLRALVAHFIDQKPEISAGEIAQCITGIDIHPLSVQVAKTTFLLALGQERIRRDAKPITLQIFLANTLLIPEGAGGLLGNIFSVKIDNAAVDVHKSTFQHPELFDEGIRLADYLADEHLNQEPQSEKAFFMTTGNRLKAPLQTLDPQERETILQNFYDIYKKLKATKEARRDGIWKFILINNYKPFFLQGQFDGIIGNPPWLVFNQVDTADYQSALRKLANRYLLSPSEHLITHLEIAAIFMAHCGHYFLKDESSQLGFVLPRSFLSADQHENTRSAKAKGFQLTEVWDLKDVQPLFNVPSCVLIAKKRNMLPGALAYKTLNGICFAGKLKEHNLPYEKAQSLLTETPTTWYYAKLGKRTAFSENDLQLNANQNFYNDKFKNGATIVPRNFYFVEVLGNPPDLNDRTILVRSHPDNQTDGKMPWKPLILEHRIHTRFLFRTALAKNILPFALIDPPLVVLPIQIRENIPKLLGVKDLTLMGEIETAQWFTQAEKLWEKHKTEHNANMNLTNYLNWQNKLTGQSLSYRYLVLYNTSGKDASAFVVEQNRFDKSFIVDCKAFWYGSQNINEAYYIAIFLNSGYSNEIIKPFQSMGLFGPRDICKKILEVPLAQYDGTNAKHVRLAELGRICTEKAGEWVAGLGSQKVSGVKLGKARLDIRKLLAKELAEADELLKKNGL